MYLEMKERVIVISNTRMNVGRNQTGHFIRVLCLRALRGCVPRR
jgi:hypothetical protein